MICPDVEVPIRRTCPRKSGKAFSSAQLTCPASCGPQHDRQTVCKTGPGLGLPDKESWAKADPHSLESCPTSARALEEMLGKSGTKSGCTRS